MSPFSTLSFILRQVFPGKRSPDNAHLLLTHKLIYKVISTKMVYEEGAIKL